MKQIYEILGLLYEVVDKICVQIKIIRLKLLS